MTTNSTRELAIWVLGFSAALSAFFLSHTFYVTNTTYAYGLVLFALTIALFWYRFRPQRAQRARWLRITGNVILTILTGVVLLYALGVATWYE